MVIGVEGVCYFILLSWIIILPKLLDIIRRQHGDWKVTGAETGKGLAGLSQQIALSAVQHPLQKKKKANK